jgi:putative DNA primase/helicase
MNNETAAIAAWSADVYAQRGVKSPEPLLGPLSRGCVTLLCGPRGSGKSWLALSLAHAVARGGGLGPWRVRRKHRAVFIDVAGSEAVLQARLMALGKPPPSLVIVPGDAQGGFDVSLESSRTALDELVTDADLVVVDGLSALVRKGRGVGTRWAALEGWLRGLRRRHAAVLLVDAKEPAMLADLADAVLKVEQPADGVGDADLRLQVRLLSARPKLTMQRFELRLALRKDGAAWTYIDDIDHRAILAYRLDRQDYSSREIAKRLGVSPATAWRLIGRGERMPPHLRDGVDLEVPMPDPPKKKRDWAAIAKLAGIAENTLPPAGGKEGPDAQRREDEGEQTSGIAPSALRAPPHLNPLPVGERTSEGDAAKQLSNSVKQ